MTHAPTQTERPALRPSMAILIAHYGKWRVALLALAALFGDEDGPVKTRPIPVPDHLREDVGLPPREDPPDAITRMARLSRW